MKKTGAKIIYMLFVIMLLGGVIAGILYLTNGGTTSPRLFDIKFNNENIDRQVIAMSEADKAVNFKAEGKLEKDKVLKIQVRALPNENAKKVKFAINGEIYNLVACKDLTDLFNIKVNENNITVSSNWDMKKFLADYFVVPIDKVEILEYGQGAYSFVDLIFTVGSINVKCGLLEFIRVGNIELDNENIVIGG